MDSTALNIAFGITTTGKSSGSQNYKHKTDKFLLSLHFQD
jgi:hypothetical protein